MFRRVGSEASEVAGIACEAKQEADDGCDARGARSSHHALFDCGERRQKNLLHDEAGARSRESTSASREMRGVRAVGMGEIDERMGRRHVAIAQFPASDDRQRVSAPAIDRPGPAPVPRSCSRHGKGYGRRRRPHRPETVLHVGPAPANRLVCRAGSLRLCSPDPGRGKGALPRSAGRLRSIDRSATRVRSRTLLGREDKRVDRAATCPSWKCQRGGEACGWIAWCASMPVLMRQSAARFVRALRNAYSPI